MTRITTRPATVEEWDDVQRALTGGGDGRSCQCTWPVLTNAQWNATTVDERQEMLRREINAGPPPGVVAYVDGEAAGWVRVGPRTSQARVPRTRIVKAGTREPLDDTTVWAVTCFSVRTEHRGRGLTNALLKAAVDHARRGGARVVEAYPVATDTTTTTANGLYVGALSIFLTAGFRVIARPNDRRAVVALELG